MREASLRLLFRLLFLLYAEDRDLLPVRHEGYRDYALYRLREAAAEIVDQNRSLSARATTWWSQLNSLFQAIAEGDTGLGLPPYNGGLFDDAKAPLLDRIALPDAELAPLIDRLVAGRARRRPPTHQLPRPVGAAPRQHLRTPVGTGGGRR